MVAAACTERRHDDSGAKCGMHAAIVRYRDPNRAAKVVSLPDLVGQGRGNPELGWS
jgi:hypothetical protein